MTNINQTITNLIPQTYYYYKAFIINDAGISYGDAGGFWFDGLELNDLESNSTIISLYPNPANDKVKLEIKGLTKSTNVIVYDINGREVRQFNINAEQTELEIEVKDLPKGIYNVKILNNNFSISRKLIVQ